MLNPMTQPPAQYPDMQKSLRSQEDIEDLQMMNDGKHLKTLFNGIEIHPDNLAGLVRLMHGQDESIQEIQSNKRALYDNRNFGSSYQDTTSDASASVTPMSMNTPPPSLQDDDSKDAVAHWHNDSMDFGDCVSREMDESYGSGLTLMSVREPWPHHSRSVENMQEYMSSGYNSAAAVATPAYYASPGPSLNSSMDVEQRCRSVLDSSNLFRARMTGATGSNQELSSIGMSKSWANWRTTTTPPHRKPCAFQKRPSLDRIDSVSSQATAGPAPVDFTQLMMTSSPTNQQRPMTCIRTQSEEDRELEEMASMFAKPRRKPINYKCDICGMQDEHLIQDCPRKDDSKALTPYQGNKLCYGEFTCPKCKRNWKSGKSRANAAQKCSKCRVDVWPKKQLQIEKAVSRGLLTSQDDADRTISTINSASTSRCPSRMSIY